MSCVPNIGPQKKAKVTQKRDKEHEIYPFELEDKIILGPDVFATADGDRISWRGVSYYRSDWKEYRDL